MEQLKKGASAMRRKRLFAAAVGVGREESVALPVVCQFRFDGQVALPFFLLEIYEKPHRPPGFRRPVRV